MRAAWPRPENFDDRPLTRAEVAAVFEVTDARIVHFETEGRLPKMRDERGRPVYSGNVVVRALLARKKVATSATQATTLRAFELFREGATLAECVRLLDVKPEIVRKLFEEYRTPLGAAAPKPDDGKARAHEDAERQRAYDAEDEARRERHAKEDRELEARGREDPWPKRERTRR